MARFRCICVLPLLAACATTPATAPDEPVAQEEEEAEATPQQAQTPEPQPVTPAEEPSAEASPAHASSPFLGEWGCRGPIQHVAQSHRATLHLRDTGRFELDYTDVTPEGGRVIRVQGDWRAEPRDDGSWVIAATVDVGSETTWTGDMHREQHRNDPDGPSFASEPQRRGVSTREREWPVTGSGDEQRLQLDAELGTRLARAELACDPGRFNR